MTDFFGFDISPEELARWDEATITLWNQLAPAQFRDAVPAEADRRFWHEDLLVRPGRVNGQIVVELGSGFGRCAIPLMEAGAQYHGIDVSRASVQIARGRHRYWPKAYFYHSVWDKDVLELLLGRAAVVFGTFFFIHQGPERRQRILVRAAELLMVGGLLSVDFWPGGDDDAAGQVYGANWRHFSVTPEQLRAECEPLGLVLSELTEPRLRGCRRDAIFEKVGHE